MLHNIKYVFTISSSKGDFNAAIVVQILDDPSYRGFLGFIRSKFSFENTSKFVNKFT